MRRQLTQAALVALAACKAAQPTLEGSMVQAEGTGPAGYVKGRLDVQWIHGAADCSRSKDPAIQVHRYEDQTYILRQSKCTHYEGPFLYLFLGSERALLLDTGATEDAATFPLRRTVQGLVEDWKAAQNLDFYSLVVAHTHSHGDHIAGDAQFEGQDHTTVVSPDVKGVVDFFKLANWPNETASINLGGRVLDVLPIPGHSDDSIAVYDRRTGILQTGDSLYPGRLYVSSWADYRASAARLVAFADALPVPYVLGNHIEMSNEARKDYPTGSTFQPNEHVLQLSKDHLQALNEVFAKNPRAPSGRGYEAGLIYDDFIVYP